MKKIEEIDPRTLDFEGYDGIIVYESNDAEQGFEGENKVKYLKVTESYEDMGF